MRKGHEEHGDESESNSIRPTRMRRRVRREVEERMSGQRREGTRETTCVRMETMMTMMASASLLHLREIVDHTDNDTMVLYTCDGKQHTLLMVPWLDSGERCE